MKLQDRLKREYRLIALAVVFFLAGGIFFWYDSSLPSSSKLPPPSAGNAAQGLSVQTAPSQERGGNALDPDFAKFPAPSQFKTFAYGKNGINGSATLPISATCQDPYITVLIFPATIDYRGDINAAIYNEAFPCKPGQAFTLTLATSDIATAPFGNYYFIIADQGTTGTWYNPRT